MRKLSSIGLPALLCLGLILAVMPASAKKGEHGKHGNKEHGRHERDEGREGHIYREDAEIIREYFYTHHHGDNNPGRGHGNCPPGLAKKHNGCLPPGIAKKYAIGDVIHEGGWASVPEELLTRLHPPPGHYYAMVDKDVVLIAEASKKIIDAVTLLSAVK